jgi:hypothetical protein
MGQDLELILSTEDQTILTGLAHNSLPLKTNVQGHGMKIDAL